MLAAGALGLIYMNARLATDEECLETPASSSDRAKAADAVRREAKIKNKVGIDKEGI